MSPEDVALNPRVAGLVRRYHTWPMLNVQSVAEHSWMVYRIMYEIFGPQPAHVIHYVLMHDVGEHVSGDPPFPVKADNPQIKKEFDRLEDGARSALGIDLPKLTQNEKERVAFCHMMEMWEHGLHDAAMGNQFGKVVADRCADKMSHMIVNMPDHVAAIFAQIARIHRIYGLAK